MGIEVTLGGREGQRESVSIPPAIMDAWRSKGSSEAEIRRLSLCYHASGLMTNLHPIESVISPVAYLQWRKGKKLVDLTWSEALEAFLEDRRRDLDESVTLRGEFGEKDCSLALAQEQILKVLRRARAVYDEWLDIRRSGLRGVIAPSYQAKVSGYYPPNKVYVWEETTERARQKAAHLKEELDGDLYVIELRNKLRIPPDDGFQDVDQAACWLYDRYPPIEGLAPYGPEGRRELYGHGPRDLYDPAILQVSVLAEATRRLRKYDEKECKKDKKCKLRREWDYLLCFYLLRGKLDPLPRLRPSRHRPMEKVYQDIWELTERYKPCWKAVLYFRYQLTDEDWSKIATLYPAANKKGWSWGQKKDIKQIAELIAKPKGKPDTQRVDLTSDELFEEYFSQVRKRMRPQAKT